MTKPTPPQIKIYPPDPIVNGESVVTYDEETGVVSMPLWYWKKMTEYVIDTQILLIGDE